MFKSVTIIGVGLMGSSLALAMKKHGITKHIIGHDIDVETLKKAFELKIIDQYEIDLNKSVQQVDLIVIATHPLTIEKIFKSIEEYSDPNTIITDILSVKKYILNIAENALTTKIKNFIPGHPIAGREHSGPMYALADLFENKNVVLTPTAYTNQKNLDLILKMWRTMQSKVICMDSLTHDNVIASTSHLPQYLSYLLARNLKFHSNEKKEHIKNLVGSGFRDMTRLSISNINMWSDICITNKNAILTELISYKQQLDTLISAIQSNDEQTIAKIFTESKLEKEALNKI